MSWYDRGWNDTDDGGNGASGGGGGGRGSGPLIFRLRLPYGMGAGRDILYLDDEPFRLWEHNGKDRESGRWNVYAPCRKRNKIGDGICPPCEKMAKDVPINLYNIGMLTAIDISFAVGKEYRGERNYYLCEKRLVPAKRGSQDYPGALADLHRIREREGRLRGLVIHQLRKGKKSPTIGDSFEVIERLNEDQIIDYLKNRVRKMIQDGTVKQACAEMARKENHGIPLPSKEFYQEKILKIDLSPAPYEDIFQPMSAVELANHFNLDWTPPAQQGMFQGGGGDDPFAGDGGFDYEGSMPMDGPPKDDSDSRPFDGAPGPGYSEDPNEDMPF